MLVRKKAPVVNPSSAVADTRRIEGPGGVITFTPKIAAAQAPKRQRRQYGNEEGATVGAEVRTKDVTIGRARRLLSSLAQLAALRDEGLRGLRAALLKEAAGMIVLIANLQGRRAEINDLAHWARRHTPGATRQAVETAFAEAQADNPNTVPKPIEIGAALDLRFVEWQLAGRPWGIHPIDASPEAVHAEQREAKLDRDRKRARE